MLHVSPVYLDVLLAVPERLLVLRELLLADIPVEDEAAHHPYHVQEPEEDVDHGLVRSPAQHLVINLGSSIIHVVPVKSQLYLICEKDDLGPDVKELRVQE